MAREVLLPQLGQTMEECTIVNVLIAVGDEVNKGDVIFEVETDKATLEMESPAEGFVKAILVHCGDTVPVNTPILILGALIDGEMEACLRNDIRITVHSATKIELLGNMTRALGHQSKVHLKIDHADEDTYISSLKELLHTVEDRRNQIQSPFRKAWRSARNSSFSFWVTLVGGFFLFLLLSPQPSIAPLFTEKAYPYIQAGLAILVLLIGWFSAKSLTQSAVEYIATNKPQKSDTPNLHKIIQTTSDDASFYYRANALLELSLGKKPEAVAINQNLTFAVLGSWTMRYQSQDDDERFAGITWYPYVMYFGLGDFFNLVEAIMNFFLRRDHERGRVARTISEKIDQLNATKVAALLQEREDHHKDEERSRLRWLRALSVLVGITLAYILGIDAADLLNGAVPGIGAEINQAKIIFNPHYIFKFLPDRGNITPGILLTGFAASAGSAFWHDQLDRLQAAKKGAEAAAKLMKQLKESKD